MKRCLFIDHYFHKKTKSTVFLSNQLSKEFCVDYAYIEKHDDAIIKLESKSEQLSYDLVVCFQLLPNREALNRLCTFKSGLIVPMYDGMLSLNDDIWKEFKDFKVLNFSSNLHRNFVANGFESVYVQYCPPVSQVNNWGSEFSLFFWQRTQTLTIKQVLKLISNSKVNSIHLHLPMDPGHERNKIKFPSKYSVTTSEWFDDKGELKETIQKSAIFFAPRLYEGIGQSFLGAMAMGRCVVAPNLPTANEYIKDGINGLLYNPKEDKQLNLSHIREIQKRAYESVSRMHDKYLEDIKNIGSWALTPRVVRMNILYDASILLNYALPGSGRTGIFFVALNLVRKLHQRNDCRLSFYINSEHVPLLKTVLNDIFGHLDFPIYTEQSELEDCQVYLSPLFAIPEALKQKKWIKKYTILYDCIPILYKKNYGENQPWWFEMFDGMNAEDHYFAISKHTKSDFLKFKSSISEENIKVIPLGADEKFLKTYDKDEIAAVKGKYKIPTDVKYVVSVCSLEPRKNLAMAVTAFIEFVKKNNIQDLVFVLVGQKWEGFSLTVPDLDQYSDKLILTGYVSDEDIPILYQGALFSIFTSKYEGFGLPILESLTCGTPVVVSNNSSMPEVAEEAGVYVDADSKLEHIQAYEKLYKNRELRETLSRVGKEQAKKWSWEGAADVIVSTMLEQEQKEFPKISIVTVVFNLVKAGRIEQFYRCINSVRKQVYPAEIEHIVIDGGSTDGTLDFIKKCYQRGEISSYISEPDQGVYDAMNKGIRKATGKYVAFLNSDDYYHDKEGLYWTVRCLESSKVDYSYGNAKVVNLNTNESSVWHADLANIPYASHYCHQTMFVKTSVLKALGGFDLKYKVSSDSDLCIRIIRDGYKGVYSPYCFVTYFIGEGISSVQREQSCSDHVNSFYEHYGKKSGLKRKDIFALWQCQGVNNLSKNDIERIRNALVEPMWIERFSSLMYGRGKKSLLSRTWKRFKDKLKRVRSRTDKNHSNRKGPLSRLWKAIKVKVLKR